MHCFHPSTHGSGPHQQTTMWRSRTQPSLYLCVLLPLWLCSITTHCFPILRTAVWVTVTLPSALSRPMGFPECMGWLSCIWWCGWGSLCCRFGHPTQCFNIWPHLEGLQALSSQRKHFSVYLIPSYTFLSCPIHQWVSGFIPLLLRPNILLSSAP